MHTSVNSKHAQVAHTLRALSLRALHNAGARGGGVRAAHARLLDKQRRVRSIVHGMRVRGEPQRNIDDVRTLPVVDYIDYH